MRAVRKSMKGRLAIDVGQVAVGLGDQLEQVAVGILEIDAAAAPVMVDLAGPFLVRAGPVGQAGLLDAPEGGIELGIVDQEGVVRSAHVLRGDEVQGDAVTGLYRPERAPLLARLDAE